MKTVMHIFSLLPDDIIREIISYTDCLYWCKREKRYVNKISHNDSRYNMISNIPIPKIKEKLYYLVVMDAKLSESYAIEKRIHAYGINYTLIHTLISAGGVPFDFPTYFTIR